MYTCCCGTVTTLWQILIGKLLHRKRKQVKLNWTKFSNSKETKERSLTVVCVGMDKVEMGWIWCKIIITLSWDCTSWKLHLWFLLMAMFACGVWNYGEALLFPHSRQSNTARVVRWHWRRGSTERQSERERERQSKIERECVCVLQGGYWAPVTTKMAAFYYFCLVPSAVLIEIERERGLMVGNCEKQWQMRLQGSGKIMEDSKESGVMGNY